VRHAGHLPRIYLVSFNRISTKFRRFQRSWNANY